MDNKKLKKQDGKRIALGQKHERDYLKKVTKDLIEVFEKDRKLCKQTYGKHLNYVALTGKGTTKKVSTAQIIRCMKALSKYLKRDKR